MVPNYKVSRDCLWSEGWIFSFLEPNILTSWKLHPLSSTYSFWYFFICFLFSFFSADFSGKIPIGFYEYKEGEVRKQREHHFFVIWKIFFPENCIFCVLCVFQDKKIQGTKNVFPVFFVLGFRTKNNFCKL